MGTFLYESIATKLEQSILNGEYNDGDRLPSERILSTQFGVSRNVIREAIKILTEKKLVTNVIGKGNYVTLPNELDLINMVESALTTTSISINEIVDAREDLEFSIGRHILQQKIKPDLTQLYEIYEQMNNVLDHPENFIIWDSRFHLALSELADNFPLKVFYMTLNNLISKSIYYGDNQTKKARITAQAEHKQIIEALEQQNLAAFHNAIHIHLQLVRNFLQ